MREPKNFSPADGNSSENTAGSRAERSGQTAITAGGLTLIGAGELMAATSRLHRDAMAEVSGAVRAVFLDTTAGFESNVDAIIAKAVEYYKQRLQTELAIASYRHAGKASPAQTARAVATIRDANFIFAGPGSPTYALEHWRGTPVWEAALESWRQGANLLFASAAAITLGRFALPVYEVFKAGRDPHWVDGLDLLGEIGLSLAIVPHFNDNSGGDNYDSRFCYMGAARFDELQLQLPPDVTILGIDEYTGIRFDPAARQAHVSGQGMVTVISDGARREYATGSIIPFSALVSSNRVVTPTFHEGDGGHGYEFADTDIPESTVDTFAEFIEGLPTLSPGDRVELLARIESASRLAKQTEPVPDAALVDLVVKLRSELRVALRWDLADLARDALASLGYEIQDTKEGTTWRRMP